MLTHKATKKQQAWPTLATGDSSNASTSFFSDQYPKKGVQVTGNQIMLPSGNAQSDDEDSSNETQVPIYKNSLGDALANALSTAHLHDDQRVKGGKKSKKAKKTLLFSTGMFNGV